MEAHNSECSPDFNDQSINGYDLEENENSNSNVVNYDRGIYTV
jgi:hypothetical protein